MSFPGQDIRKIYMDEILRLEEEGSVFRVFMNARPAISSGYLRAQVWFELPDGGVARLRVHGEGMPDPRLFGVGPVDLAALENGGLVLDCSNRFYSSPQNLIFPGIAKVMGDGWETARRRDDKNDWVHIRLAGRGRVRLAEIDTSYFLGNSPGAAQLTGLTDDGEWVTLLPRTDLLPDTRHRFLVGDQTAVREVRLDIYPDGGLARLRLFGELT